MTSVLLHDAVDLCQPEPRSLPGLGGEEGFEESPLDGGRHAEARVRYRERGPFPRRHARERRALAFLHRAAGELDPKASSTRHRVARVEGEVGHHLLDSDRVDLGHALPRSERGADDDVLGDGPLEQVHGLPDARGEIDPLATRGCAVAEVQNLADQLSAPARLVGDGPELDARVVGERGVVAQQLRVGQHHRQDIVEVVRDAGGELPGGGEPHLLLRPLPGCALARHLPRQEDVAAARDGADAQIEHLLWRFERHLVGYTLGAGGRGQAHRTPGAGERIREPPPQELLPPHIEKRLGDVVDQGDAARPIDRHQAIARAPQDRGHQLSLGLERAPQPRGGFRQDDLE